MNAQTKIKCSLRVINCLSSRDCEVETWKKAHQSLLKTHKIIELTLQSDLKVARSEVEEWEKTYQEQAKSLNTKEDKYKEDLYTLEQAQAMAVEGMHHA